MTSLFTIQAQGLTMRPVRALMCGSSHQNQNPRDNRVFELFVRDGGLKDA